MPSQGQQQGRVFLQQLPAQLIALGRASQKLAAIHALQSQRQQAHRGKHGSAAAHPIPHRKASQPLFRIGRGVKGTALLGNAHSVGKKVQAALLKKVAHLHQAVLGFHCAAAFANHNHHCLRQLRLQTPQHHIHPVRVGVVNEEQAQPVGRALQSLGNKHRPQAAAANAHHQHIAERLTLAAHNLAGVHLLGKLPNGRLHLLNLLGYLRRGRQLGRAQPVMPHHPLLVWVGNRAALQGLHILQRLLQHSQIARHIQRLLQTAKVQAQASRRVKVKVRHIPPPLSS